VWVWDTDVPEKDAQEEDETWNVFKEKIDKIELGRDGGYDHSLKFSRKECTWYRSDQMHRKQAQAWDPLDKTLAAAQ
jgi:hypothetical protein